MALKKDHLGLVFKMNWIQMLLRKIIACWLGNLPPVTARIEFKKYVVPGVITPRMFHEIFYSVHLTHLTAAATQKVNNQNAGTPSLRTGPFGPARLCSVRPRRHSCNATQTYPWEAPRFQTHQTISQRSSQLRNRPPRGVHLAVTDIPGTGRSVLSDGCHRCQWFDEVGGWGGEYCCG